MTAVETAFRENERFLWGLGYRMTGSAQDADDIVQEAFARAVARPPQQEWRPWLVKVAVNLGRDRLRERKAREYPGQWLPEPIAIEAAPAEQAPDARYGMLESVTFAFLLALEALTPKQRAVLILSDVLDYSGKEIAEALDVAEGDVRTTHHRARAAMEKYDAARCIPTPERRARTRDALAAFLGALAKGDASALERILAKDVRAMGDGAGKYRAALHAVRGWEKVARFFLGIAKKERHVPNVTEVLVNGLPGLIVERPPSFVGDSPKFLLTGDVDEAGRLIAINSVLVPEKLSRVA